MKRIYLLNVLFFFFTLSVIAQTGTQHIIIETNFGDMEAVLYDETPKHRDNMLKLIDEGFYKNHLFHRVINNFMIQGGDPHSVGAPKGQRLGTGGPGYKIDAEFNDKLFHKKGALAAARMGDNINPEKQSSGSQFYIVEGQVFTKDQLAMMQTQMHHKPFSKEQIEAYTTIGGTPHLDGSYTVFGEIVSGFNVLEKISDTETDNMDRPINDVVFSIRRK